MPSLATLGARERLGASVSAEPADRFRPTPNLSAIPDLSAAAVPSLFTHTRALPFGELGGTAVYLTADGRFTLSPEGAPTADSAQTLDALWRAGELIGDSDGNLFEARGVDPQLLGRVVDSLEGLLEGDAPSAQLRSSAATVLLHVLEASDDEALRNEAFALYRDLAAAEPEPGLKRSLVSSLARSPVSGWEPAAAALKDLQEVVWPKSPPYERWFADGDSTVGIALRTGDRAFQELQGQLLEEAGFEEVPGGEEGSRVYERTDRPANGEPTTFRVTVSVGSDSFLQPLADAETDIVAFDGHANWGRTATDAVRRGPELADGGQGKLVLYNMCAGKGAMDVVAKAYPNAQLVTTFGASMFNTDDGKEFSEATQAMLAMMEGISGRETWDELHARIARSPSHPRSWEHWVTPATGHPRERVLDGDLDGQADALDRHYTVESFLEAPAAAEEPALELSARAPASAPGRVRGQASLVTVAESVNRLSEFSKVLHPLNADSKVVANGYFEPEPGAPLELVRFTPVREADGRSKWRMEVNSHFAHASDETLRAVAIFELNRFLLASGKLRLDPVDTKLNALLMVAKSLDVDEGRRDAEVWSALLEAYSLPPLPSSVFRDVLRANHDAYSYAGSPAMVAEARAALAELDAGATPGAVRLLDALALAESGQPGGTPG